MSRSGPPHLALVLATLAVALLPFDWRFHWTSEIARVVRVPLRPFTHGLNLAVGWLRPAPALPGPVEVPEEARDLVASLLEEKEALEVRWRQERERADRLETQLAEVTTIPPDARRAAGWIAPAQVTRRPVGDAGGAIEVTVVGADESTAIPLGAIAVSGGVHLLGRVDPGPDGPGRTGLVVPLEHASTGLLQAVIEVEGRELPVRVHLAAREELGLVGDVDADAAPKPGDRVRLDDDRWPAYARQLVVGRVESATRRDDEPLRVRVVVRPFRRARDLAQVTLLGEGVAGGSP